MPRPRTNHIFTFSPTLAQRLWAKVDRRNPDECWPWTGSCTHKGYGIISIGLTRNGRAVQVPASRAAWMVVNGEYPGDLVVRHRCDNPPCCNPDHLEVGTVADNNQDMFERGRHRAAKGEDVGGVRLTEDQVREVVDLRGQGFTLQVIAARFGVHYGTIQHILNGKTWTHVTGLPRINRLAPVPHKKRDLRGSQNNLSKLTEEEVRAIHVMRREGKTNKEIAEHFSVRPHTIYKIVSGRSWTHVTE